MNPYAPPEARDDPQKPRKKPATSLWVLIVIVALAPPALLFGITVVVLTILRKLGVT